jgi:hypothetical protein
VVHVAHDRLQRGVRVVLAVLAQERDGEVDADHAVRVPYGVELAVGEVAGGGAEGVGVGVGGDERGVREAGDVPEALSLRWERSIRTPSRLHSRTSSLPASVNPGPVSGDDGNRNGTPCA